MAWTPIEHKPGQWRTVRQPPDTCPEGHPWTPGRGYHHEYVTCGCATSRIVGWSGHDLFTCIICNGQAIDPPCEIRG